MNSYDIVKKNLKRFIQLQKQSCDYVFNMVIMVQEQFETMAFMVGVPVKNQALVDLMHANFKKNCDYVKDVIDNGFEKMDSYVSPLK